MVAKRSRPSKVTLLRRVATLSGVRLPEVIDVYQALVYVIFEDLADNGIARLPGLLELFMKGMKGRQFKSNLTGGVVSLPDRLVPKTRFYAKAKKLILGREKLPMPVFGDHMEVPEPQNLVHPLGVGVARLDNSDEDALDISLLDELPDELEDELEETLPIKSDLIKQIESIAAAGAVRQAPPPQEQESSAPRRLWEHVHFSDKE